MASNEFFHLLGSTTARMGGMMSKSMADVIGTELQRALVREVRALKTHEHHQPARGLDGQYVQLGSVLRVLDELLGEQP